MARRVAARGKGVALTALPEDRMSVSHPHQSGFVAGKDAPQRAGAAQRKVAMRTPV
jgi:hypothetical protein